MVKHRRRPRLIEAILGPEPEGITGDSREGAQAPAEGDPLAATLDATDKAVHDKRNERLHEYQALMAPGVAALREELVALKEADKNCRPALLAAREHYRRGAWEHVDPPIVRKLALGARQMIAGSLMLLDEQPRAIQRKIKLIESREPSFFKHFLVPTVAENDWRDIRGLVGVAQRAREVLAQLDEIRKEIESYSPHPPATVELPSMALSVPRVQEEADTAATAFNPLGEKT